MAAGLAAFSPAGVVAQETSGQSETLPAVASVEKLVTTLQIDAVIEVLRTEGVAYGASIEDDMFPGAGGAAWRASVGDIYDPRAMKATFEQRLLEELRGKDSAVIEMEAFFATATGQRVLSLELAARRALLADDAELAAQISWNALEAGGGPRVALLRRFAGVNDLVEANVSGALNANLAFYKGMAATGGFGAELPEAEMLADVWAQEPQIRQQTEDWVYPYLNLAYSTLSDQELSAYVAFSESDAGQTLNTALFAAFDAVFTPISHALGAAAALRMTGQDI